MTGKEDFRMLIPSDMVRRFQTSGWLTNRASWLLVLVATAAAPACPAVAATMATEAGAKNASESLSKIAQRYSDHMIDRDVFTAAGLRKVAAHLASLSEADLAGEAAFSTGLLSDLEALPRSALHGEDALTYDSLRWLLKDAATATQDYPFSFPGPYSYFDLNYISDAIASNPLQTDKDRSAVLTLTADAAARIESVVERTRRQIARGVYMPKAQVPRAVAAAGGFRQASLHWGDIPDSRLTGMDEAARQAFRAALKANIERTGRGIDALLEVLGPSYLAAAPEQGGMGRYPGGKEYYRMLAKRHTTLDRSPEQLRALGERLVAQNNKAIEHLLTRLQLAPSRQQLRERVRTDPRFIASSPEDVNRRYQECLRGMESALPRYFTLIPAARYRAVPLPAEQSGMTFGYYQPADASNPYGEYRYNVSDLSHRPMISACAIIFHELIPGHHFHLALQQENASLPDFRRATSTFGAFNEGWAEYASNLGMEMNAYPDDYAKLGRLMLNAMTLGRLIVDTGLNYFGWTYDQARQWMKDNTFASDVEIESDILRYSADLPGQALCYGAGFNEFSSLRQELSRKLGTGFDIKAFNREMISHGALPLDVVRENALRVLRVDKTPRH
jgi:uncharacterized protein (DUF885 family)